jgi:asparagine synthetase B (glutamine-hydrolysing)
MLNGVSAVDRTGMLNNFKTSYDPIPTVEDFNKTFRQVCLETAEQYWIDYDYLEVLWSGGIDSTATALALLETKTATKKLVMVCTQNSIDEYPLFYDRYKEFCQVLTSDEFFSIDRVNTPTAVITGDGGDQIFGSQLVVVEDADLHKTRSSWHEMLDWPDVFRQSKIKTKPNSWPPKIAAKVPWTKEEKNHFIEKLEQHTTACPFPIVSCFDMAWWLNFSTKMNYVAVRIPVISIEKFNKSQEMLDLTTRKAFYLNDDFQRWSMTNHNLKISTEGKSYKQPAKDFIYSITGDADYALNKRKEPSTPKLLEDNWLTNWKKDLTANYVMLDDGRFFNTTRPISTALLEEIFKKERT